MCPDTEQRGHRRAACRGWCRAGGTEDQEASQRGRKARGKWELVWYTSQEEERVREDQK